MSTIDRYFVAALNTFVLKEKSQRAFALKHGIITPQYLNHILLGKKYGSDEIKRKLAGALGYDGRKYEDFLELGRAAIEGGSPADEVIEDTGSPIEYKKPRFQAAITSERELELLRKNEALTDEIISINKQLADKDDCLKNKDCQLEARAAFIQKLGDANVQLVEILKAAGLEHTIPSELLSFVTANRPEESEVKR